MHDAAPSQFKPEPQSTPAVSVVGGRWHPYAAKVGQSVANVEQSVGAVVNVEPCVGGEAQALGVATEHLGAGLAFTPAVKKREGFDPGAGVAPPTPWGARTGGQVPQRAHLVVRP